MELFEAIHTRQTQGKMKPDARMAVVLRKSEEDMRKNVKLQLEVKFLIHLKYK